MHFGPLPSLEDLVNPPGELGSGENPDKFESDADIIEVVRRGVDGEVEEEGDDDEIEECPPPQMSRAEMAKRCETLRDGKVRFGSVLCLFWPNPEPDRRFGSGDLPNPEPEPRFGVHTVRFGFGGVPNPEPNPISGLLLT
ncbi:hypothetical protein EDB84DRAFT_1443972 [Lactarius hengduanensis]|nr:hypothetical protein EDB84DRAFT_1443972 [Lactarius hengduanensis]